ncbi:SnoaL-domain-containing protein [Whalleya microplaca]|nr:SnoaL-domain-containing protein [Whalleya microplaca]
MMKCTPESYASHTQSVGEVEVIVDAITVDHESHPAPTGKTISSLEQRFNWFTEGKLSKMLVVADRDEILRQLLDPTASYSPDLISQQKYASEVMFPTRKLEDVYEAYIACVCHSEVVFNAKALTTEGYRLMIQGVLTAICDIRLGLHTVVGDSKAQRVATTVGFTGTPVETMAGAKPSGRSFVGGRIARVWSIVDWASCRQQLSEPS